MWDCNKTELINRISNLQRMCMIPMGQCGFILSDGSSLIAIDTVVSDLYYKGTANSRRLIPPPFRIDETPVLQAMLISHSHADHLDTPLVTSQASRNSRFKAIAPSFILQSLEIPDSMKADIGDYGEVSIGDFRIKTIPVPHTEYEESAPGHSLYYGFLITINGIGIFHAGDTIPSQRLLNDLGRYGDITYALLPINGRDKERESKGIIGNMDINEAIDFALAAKAGTIIPTHFDMFRENGADINEFIRQAEENKIKSIIPIPGRIISLA